MQIFGVWKKSAGGTCTNGMKKKRKNWKLATANFWSHFWKIKHHQTTLRSQQLLCRVLVFEQIPAGGTCTNGLRKRRKKLVGELRISGLHFWKIKDHQNTLRIQHLLCRVLVFDEKSAGGTCTNGMKKKRKKWKWGAANLWVAFLEDQTPPNSPPRSAITMQSFGVW